VSASLVVNSKGVDVRNSVLVNCVLGVELETVVDSNGVDVKNSVLVN
jgi:hypothetical protein